MKLGGVSLVGFLPANVVEGTACVSHFRRPGEVNGAGLSPCCEVTFSLVRGRNDDLVGTRPTRARTAHKRVYAVGSSGGARSREPP
jgi:hypothetical protein